MSRTLKRPMFRKGGEVMEGIMTGIKPREKFLEGTKDPRQDMFGNITKQMNLIDKVAGVGDSPLSDPLTQFLLSYGPALVGGEAAGGTKLQEIVGAAKTPLATAIKAQTLKDAGRRKLATSLISKQKTSDFLQKWNQVKGSDIYPDTAEGLQKFRNDYAKGLSFERKPKSGEDIAYEKQKARIEGLVEGSKVGNLPPDIIYDDASKTIKALDQLRANPERKNIPVSNKKPYVDSDDAAKAFEEQQIIAVEPDSEYVNGVYYYNYNNKSWYQFDGEKLVFKFKG